jgi:hypothetical protein
MERADLEARARRAYEWGLLKKGLTRALWALPAMALSFSFWGPRMCVRAGPAILLMAAGLVWRGGPIARGVVPGLWAGTLSVVALFFIRCGAQTSTPWLCFCMAAGGGLISGLVVSGFGSRLGTPRPQLASAAGMAALTGLLGCTAFGVGGALGLCVGAVLGAAPGYLSAPRPASAEV